MPGCPCASAGTPQVEADAPTATAALGAGLEAWLHDLKTTAEAHAGDN